MDEQDDIKIEGDEPEATEKAESKVAKMREEIAGLRKEKQEYMDGWQRAKADYVNLLKRFETETKSSKQAGLLKAVEAILPAYDALERSKEHGEIPEGFVGITKQLESAFAGFGLAPLGAIGEAFNPAYHEAFGQDPVTEEEKDETVTAILEKGWKIGDPSTGSGQETVIRPAKVRVGQFAS